MIKKTGYNGRATAKATDKKLNCRNALNCPLNGNYLVKYIVYKAEVEPIKSPVKER